MWVVEGFAQQIVSKPPQVIPTVETPNNLRRCPRMLGVFYKLPQRPSRINTG